MARRVDLRLSVTVPSGTSAEYVVERINWALDEEEPRLLDWRDWFVGEVSLDGFEDGVAPAFDGQQSNEDNDEEEDGE